jgi:acyl carrier protein
MVRTTVAWWHGTRYDSSALRAAEYGAPPVGRFKRSSTVPSVQEIEDKVFQIVSEQLSVDRSELSRGTSFVNDLNADSLDTVELVMELEDEFEMTIPDEEAEKLKTVGEAIDYIQAHKDE